MANDLILESINMLGMIGEDKITNVSGPITSVCFDLYGCVQVCIERGLDKDGKRHESYWYDVSRISLLDESHRVMAIPSQYVNKDAPKPQSYEHGPSEKPSPPR